MNEPTARAHIRILLDLHLGSEKGGWSKISKAALNDGSFLTRLFEDGSERSISWRKYTQLISWFSENWHPATPWPAMIARPESASVAA